ncbi:MAG TPA: hypothetical protein VH138_10625 [Vicinamibacterales bacterium]|nr:hypothetical protein [Vicinamibacterales bacterium]
MRRNSGALIAAALIALAVWLRLWHLGWMPGIDGDEGWWGVQALRWLHGQPYEARTTNGNPIDVFLLVPLGLAHAVWAPSFTLLRAVPAVLNLIALPIGFLLVRWLYGSTTAWIQTVATAVLPTAIAHSRLCQDPSQSIPWTVIVVGLSLLSVRERSRAWLYGIAACVTFVVAVRTHPTNVFVAPFVALSVMTALEAGLPATRRGRAVAIVILLVAVAVPLRFVLPQVQSFVRSNELLNKPWLSIAAGHLAHPSSWFEFLVNYGRLFDGVVVYHYLSDPHVVSVASDLGFAIAAPAIVCGFGLALRGARTSPRSRVDGALAIGWLSSAFLFFAFAGPEALRPNFERWGLCLIAPGTFVIARGISGWIDAAPRWRVWTIGVSCALAFGLLGAFSLNFVRVFETSGGRAHVTFVTASPEPKQQAFDAILSRRSHDEPVLIVGQLWWQFYPIDYLAQAHPGIMVVMKVPPDDAPELRDARARGRVFFVEFAGTPELTRAENWIRARARQMTDTTIRDKGGRDLLHVIEVR